MNTLLTCGTSEIKAEIWDTVSINAALITRTADHTATVNAVSLATELVVCALYLGAGICLAPVRTTAAPLGTRDLQA